MHPYFLRFSYRARQSNLKYFFGAALLMLLLLLGSTLLYLFSPKPNIYQYTTYSKAFLDTNKKLLRITLAEDERYRLYQPLDNISPDLINSVLLYEDQHYYEHMGIDPLALLRAFWNTYVTGNRRIGASTITMQVARLHWRMDSSTIGGKVQQILRALQLNRHYSKDEILEAYLNLASYGYNIEGIGAASLIYFNKTPDKLTWLEALTLSVVPQNPNRRQLASAQGLAQATTARQRLFKRWVDKFPEDKTKEKFLSIPLHIRSLKQLPFDAPHFINHQLSSLSRWQSGLIHTTLDRNLQHLVEQGVKTYVQQRRKDGIRNAAALLVNYQTHEIKAMVGSADFFDKEISGQVNGTLAKRSPGSTLKPFVYALAMDEGIIHPMTMLRDAHKRFGGFTPENFDRQFLGPVFAKTALIESRNVPAVDLQARLRERSFFDFLKEANISGLKSPAHYGLSLALGGGEVTMLELVSLYTALANGGKLKPIKSLKEQNGNNGKKNQTQTLLTPEASFLILDILRNNKPPKSHKDYAKFNYKNNVAWKTGTSWAFRDAWSVGISGPYVLATWVGNFNGEGNAAFVGRSAAGPLLFSLLNAVFPNISSNKGWRLEDSIDVDALNIKKVDICANTGDLPGRHCPRTTQSWFIPGVSPIKVSNIHRAITIDSKTGLRTCQQSTASPKINRDPSSTVQKIYEFWPSDFLQLFQQAGISLKTPPAFSPECNLSDKSAFGITPNILSPLATISYVLQAHRDNPDTIPFSASADSDVDTLFWFVDGAYVGRSKPSEAFAWLASSGSFSVTVVDDSGRASTSPIKVVLEN